MEKDIFLLGVETSCDETSAAIIKNGRHVCSNVISSQIELHKKYGGVVPEIASRKHIENISPVVDRAFAEAGLDFGDISGVTVTHGPGLVGALLVGLSYAKGLAFTLNKPLIGVHHIEGHISANYLNNTVWEPPFICLVVSGGHTNIVCVEDYCRYRILGSTRDDAAGEAYDKVARALGLGYPGGPAIDVLAKSGDPEAIDFPRAISHGDSLDFSFSGLKSSVLNYLNKAAMTGMEIVKPDVAASFQAAVIDVLVGKTIQACRMTGMKSVALAGGVTANSALRARMRELCEACGFALNIPETVYCTDNAAMIASRGYYSFIQNQFSDLSLNAYPSLRLS